jgi:uncharacterized membrane protein
MKPLRELYWHDLFEAGVFLKALNSVWETLAGIFLLTSLHNWLTRIFVLFSSSELLGDRDDFIFNYAHRHMMTFTDHTRIFVGVYLLFHGIMNAFLSYNLYRNRLWAYPVSIAFTSTFFIYQLYRLTHTHSAILMFVSLLDIIFIILTWHEYRRQLRKQRGHHYTPPNVLV